MNTPYDYSPRLVKDKRAQQIADLTMVDRDLQHASDCTVRLLDIDLTRPDFVLVRALATSAFIACRRCFVSGARFTLERGHLCMLTETELAAHERVILWANQMFAHSENDAVNAAVGIMVGTSKTGARKLGGLWSGGIEVATPPPELVCALRDLSERVRNEIVVPQMDKAKAALLNRLVMMPVEEIAAWDCALSTTLPSQEQSGPRRRHNKPEAK